jgi:hypothetical protein
MKPPLLPLIAMLALVLGTGVAVTAVTGNHRGQGPVYSVLAVQAGLRRSPAAWVGRTILVQGIVVAGEPVGYPSPSLVDADATAAVDPLPLSRIGPDRPRAFLRRLPWLGSLAPRAQAIRWDEVAVYRVRLRVQTHAFCGASVCYEAVLLDATP